MKRNGRNQKMPKGAMVEINLGKGGKVETELTSDLWSQMTNTQRRDCMKKYKEDKHNDLLARVEANKAKKAKDNK